jgi:hypothetical protein
MEHSSSVRHLLGGSRGPSTSTDTSSLLSLVRRGLRLATTLGPLRRFNLAHPRVYGCRAGFRSCPK